MSTTASSFNPSSMKEDENSDEDSVVGAQTSRKVQCKHILVINFACVIPSGQRLQSATGSSTISKSRQIEPIMRQMVIMEQILSRLDEICEAQKTMTDKYGPAPTQSASSNSGAGDSSHAPTNEEESSMYMEMATFLLFPSTKSERGALDQAKVTKIIYLINKRLPPL
ncbi:hypothetical protein EMCRGX_G019490 [Ephydatia muelleri]